MLSLSTSTLAISKQAQCGWWGAHLTYLELVTLLLVSSPNAKENGLPCRTHASSILGLLSVRYVLRTDDSFMIEYCICSNQRVLSPCWYLRHVSITLRPATDVLDDQFSAATECAKNRKRFACNSTSMLCRAFSEDDSTVARAKNMSHAFDATHGMNHGW